ncbi:MULTISPECIES: carbohydrate ABC transporter permease [unclassified Paenibacillus]|jgi:multiple sugar transport system permease protein|uniref:carbohydrate ABC transporter permease n=1 Tax=unclassified Paenibacillus TaxID=185978 RepID=UPI00278A202A|nr:MULTISPECIES: carbohydrate ABC transporter permease [unclassified Paenibacillus]MDQ0901177.1 multiple sugar transport system permease protein [Paenibacillus sp. V4I7]MDQ0920345.1 multiple sugar transport system permease protein [Paenibacillus sp. V4I5]
MKNSAFQIFRFIILLVGSISMLYPLFWMIIIALKGNDDVFSLPPDWYPKEFNWENFVIGTEQIHFWRAFSNSMIIAVLCTIGQIISSVLVGYGLGRLRFPGRKMWFSLFVGSLMLPGFIGLIPLFHLYTSLGWYNTWLPIIVPAFFGNASFTFLFIQFSSTIPKSFDEAAKIDGANDLRILWNVIVPMSMPIIITMMIFSFQGSWNQYLEPVIYLVDQSKWPLAVSMASYASTWTTQWNYFMAADLLYMLPMLIIFFIGQKYFMQGLGSVNSAGLK